MPPSPGLGFLCTAGCGWITCTHPSCELKTNFFEIALVRKYSLPRFSHQSAGGTGSLLCLESLRIVKVLSIPFHQIQPHGYNIIHFIKYTGITDAMDLSLSRFQETVMDREAWCAVVHGVAKHCKWLNDWAELTWILAAGISVTEIRILPLLPRKDTEARRGWRKLSWLSRDDWEAQPTGKVLPFILSTWESGSGNHSLLHTPHKRRTWYSGQCLVRSLVLIWMVRSLRSRGRNEQPTFLFDIWVLRRWVSSDFIFCHTHIWASEVALVVKNRSARAGQVKDVSLSPGLGRSPVGGHDNPLQYSCLENPMDRGALQATVQRVSKSQKWLKWLCRQCKSQSFPHPL